MVRDVGKEQARLVAMYLKECNYPIRKILCSPLIRCVQTADIVAQVLGLGADSVCVEPGLVEQAKSMRGKAAPDPLPTWEPLILSPVQLLDYSYRIDHNYIQAVQVCHAKNVECSNHVQELLPEMGNDDIDQDEVTRLRCRSFIRSILGEGDGQEECVICVGHGATVKYCAQALQEGLPAENLLISGERRVGCFAVFRPFAEEVWLDSDMNINKSTEDIQPWFAPAGIWVNDIETNNACLDSKPCDHHDDRG